MSYFRSTAGRVVSCILYLIAGVLTGAMAFYLGSLGHSLGSVSSIMDKMIDISLVGSLLLGVAAVTALFSFLGTGYIALTGVIAVWVFFAALLASSLTARVGAGTVILEGVIMLVLLIASAAYPIASIVSLKRAAT